MAEKKSKIPVGAETSAAQLKRGWVLIFLVTCLINHNWIPRSVCGSFGGKSQTGSATWPLVYCLYPRFLFQQTPTGTTLNSPCCWIPLALTQRECHAAGYVNRMCSHPSRKTALLPLFWSRHLRGFSQWPPLAPGAWCGAPSWQGSLPVAFFGSSCHPLFTCRHFCPLHLHHFPQWLGERGLSSPHCQRRCRPWLEAALIMRRYFKMVTL